jgi:hypothetical protein
MASESLDVKSWKVQLDHFQAKLDDGGILIPQRFSCLTVTALSGVLDQLKPGTGILLAAAHGITEKLGVIDKYVIKEYSLKPVHSYL